MVPYQVAAMCRRGIGAVTVFLRKPITSSPSVRLVLALEADLCFGRLVKKAAGCQAVASRPVRGPACRDTQRSPNSHVEVEPRASP